MPGWDGNGGFQRVYSWVSDKLAGINITASRMDDDTNNITNNGFGNCLTRDGQGSATDDLPMNGFRHTGVGNALTRDEYLALGQLQDGSALFAAAGGTGDALTIGLTPSDNSLVDGMIVYSRALAPNTLVNPTLQLGTSVAHTITKFGGLPLGIGSNGGIVANQPLIFQYRATGTKWELLNPSQTSQTGPQTLTSGNLLLAATALVLDLSSYTGYTKLELILSGYATGASASQQMQFSVDAGATFLATNYSWSAINFEPAYTSNAAGSDTAITIAIVGGLASTADHTIELFGINQAVAARVQSRAIVGAQGALSTGRHATVSINAIKLLSSAACTGGTYLLVGYK